MRSAIFTVAALSMLVIPTAGAREWTDSTGKNKTEAEFVELQDGVVQLMRKDGRTVSVPISRLCAADQIFALEESTRLEAIVPRLGDEGKKHALELLNAVRRVCAPLDGKQDVNGRQLEQTVEDAKKEFLVHSARIVEVEGSRRAVTPVIIVLLRDMNVAVRATGVSLLEDLGKSASAALPAVAQLLNDKNLHVRQMASEVLSSLSDETDVAAPALVELIGGADVELAQRAAQALGQIAASGPRCASVVPQLVGQVKDTKRKSELRVISASALNQILWRLQPNGYDGFDHRSIRHVERLLDYGEFENTPEIRRALNELAGFDETLVPNTCRQLLPVLGDEDDTVRGAVTTVISISAPELIVELPSATFVKLLMEPSPAYEDSRRDERDSLVNAVIRLTEEGRMPVKLTPEQAVALLAKEESEYQVFAQSQLQLMGGKAKAAVPELVKLTAHQRAEVRSTALSMLSSQLFSQREDLSMMPTLQVRVTADEQGLIKSIMTQGEPIADVDKLKELVATYEPPKSKTNVDIDTVLKRALSDSDEDVRYVALRGLGNRGTAAAQSILRETRRTAVDREMREMVGQMLSMLEHRGGRFEIPLNDEPSEQSGESPFSVDEPKVKRDPITVRDFAVALSVDPGLKLEPFHAILTAISAGQGTGIRLAGTTGDSAELQLRPPQERKGDEYGREQYLEEHLNLRLTTTTDDGRAELSIRSPSNERWMRVPNYEALQFLLNFTFSRHQDQRMQMRLDVGFDRRDEIGRDALPYLVTLRGDPDVRVTDMVATLNAVGAVNDEKSGQRDLLQWVKFSVDDKPAQLWFLKVTEPDATKER